MTSLTKAVRFRHLSQQLKSTEFTQFLCKLVHVSGKDSLLNVFFSHFTSPHLSKLNNKIDVDDTIQIISNIIRARKDKPIPSQTIRINQLNDNVIGVISSFLNQTEYARFSICCRSILIGCNSPNTLQKINLDLFDIPYSSINLRLYPSIKSIEFNSRIFEGLNFVANSVEHLRLKNLFGTPADYAKFLNEKHINFEAIKKLDFIIPENSTVSNARNPAGLWGFFSKFKMVQHFELKEQFTTSFSGDGTKNLFPNLQSFSAKGSTLSNGIINSYSRTLQSLQFSDNAHISLENTSFDILTELAISDACQHTIQQILKSAKKLEKVQLIRLSERVQNTQNTSAMQNTSAIQNTIMEIVSSQFRLKYIDVGTSHKNWKSVANGIEKGLFKVKKQNKAYFKIKIKIECTAEIDLNEVMLRISRMTHVLQLSKLEDFMVLFEFIGDKTPKRDVLDGVVKEYMDCESTVNVYTHYDENNNDCMIVTTNMSCKINGYSETWLT